MQQAAALAVANIPAVAVFGMAAVLAWWDKPGWGWLIFAGLFLTVSPKGD